MLPLGTNDMHSFSEKSDSHSRPHTTTYTHLSVNRKIQVSKWQLFLTATLKLGNFAEQLIAMQRLQTMVVISEMQTLGFTKSSTSVSSVHIPGCFEVKPGPPIQV